MNECQEIIRFGDWFGPNIIVFECELSEGHKGTHRKSGESNGQKYEITWENKIKEEK
jgi:hypothetical protein